MWVLFRDGGGVIIGDVVAKIDVVECEVDSRAVRKVGDDHCVCENG